MKTKPITLRFEQEHLDLLMEKEGYKTAGKAINFLLARYFWGHQLNGAAPSVAQIPAGDLRTGTGKPIADLAILPPLVSIYQSFIERLKTAVSIDQISEIDGEIKKEPSFGPQQKQELHFIAVNLSKKLDC
jgi:hypothetical protein